jgi:predicted nuclease of restriction endonuclease-like (RecB) superfamily
MVKHPTSTLRAGFYKEVAAVLRSARARAYRAVNFAMVEAYWNVGRLIVEEEQRGKARAEYAAFVIPNLSRRLTNELGPGFGEANLKNFRQFYLAFPRVERGEIGYTLCSELTWSHYRVLMRVADPHARAWYFQEAVKQGWVVRSLERQIHTFAFHRSSKSARRSRVPSASREQTRSAAPEPRDFIKDPYVLEFLEVKESSSFRESELEQAIISQLQAFMLELGKGFAFVGRQFRVSTDTKHFFIDLVFYNYILKCFVLMDLKTGDLTHQDIGQMDMYVRLFEDTVRGGDDNPTVGLILCSEKDKSLVKYSVLNESRQLFASKYQPYMPSETELRDELVRERALVVPDRTQSTRPAPRRLSHGSTT